MCDVAGLDWASLLMNKTQDLSSIESGKIFEADLVIIGAGPAGLTLARELSGHSARVIVLECGGVQEFGKFSELNRVEGVFNERYDPFDPFRLRFHGGGNPFWDPQIEVYGVRLRGIGGSSAYWGGKVATFDPVDFEARSWIPHSGWPISRDSLAPHLERARDVLNLGPHVYDEGLWSLLDKTKPTPDFKDSKIQSTFWQFARSQVNKLDMIRFARDIGALDTNIRILTNATVTQITLDATLSRVRSLTATSLEGRTVTVNANFVVLAAGAIENARILLSSNSQLPTGLGNKNDLVGRFLLDHPANVVGHFEKEGLSQIIRRFGFFGLRENMRTYIYSHGVSLKPKIQQEEELLNASISFTENIAPDDPFKAAMRLVRRQSQNPLSDLYTSVRGAGLLAQGVGMKMFQCNAFPESLKDPFINIGMKLFPNRVVRQYQSLGAPHKLVKLDLIALSEQEPSPHNRVTLTSEKDPLGIPRARCAWAIGEREGRSIARLATLFSAELKSAGLPQPILADWIVENRPEDFRAADTAHSAGTTRMGSDPTTGVVDVNLKLFDCEGIYLAGNSIFPTIGHANPTLMNVAFAIRLADHLKTLIS